MADPRTQAISCEQLAVPATIQSPRCRLGSVTLAATGGGRPPELRSALGTSSSLSLHPVVRDLRDARSVERADDGVVRLVHSHAKRIEAH